MMFAMFPLARSQRFLNICTAKVQMREFGTQVRQCHFAGHNLVAQRAAKLVKPFGGNFLTLGTLAGRNLRDHIHGGQGPDAAVESVAQLPALCGEAQFAILPRRMTAVASMVVKHILRHFFLALTRRGHLIQTRARRLRGLPLLGGEHGTQRQSQKQSTPGTIHYWILPAFPRGVKSGNCPMQDEPERDIRFQSG